MNIKKTIEKIEDDRVYSLTEIVKKGLIPPVKSYPTAYRIILEDKAKPKTERTIDADIIGEGRARTIRIKGANLKKHLETL